MMLRPALGLWLALMGNAPEAVEYERICAGDTWSYLLFSPKQPHEALLINAGSDPTAQALRMRLAPNNEPACDILAVLLTSGDAREVAGLRGLPPKTPAFVDRADILLAIGQARPRALAPWARWRLHRPSPLSSPPQPVPLGTPMRWNTLTVRAIALPGHTAGALGYVAGDTLFVGDTRSVVEPNVWWTHAVEDAQPSLARETHEELCRAARCYKTRWIAPSRGPVVPTLAWCPTPDASPLAGSGAAS